jgi:hypothetical protein
MTTATKETLGFQAEVKQLLQLMIHSLYSNKEIFLRELISNASDAADKLRFEAMTHPDWYESNPDLAIQIELDKAARTLTISDNGIGMSRDEVISNLGTIAKSGTKEFFSKLSGDQQKDAALIGQFGVGFIRRLSLPTALPLKPAGLAYQPVTAFAGSRMALANSPSSPLTGLSAAPPSSCTCAKAKMTSFRLISSSPSFANTPITFPYQFRCAKKHGMRRKKSR